MEKEKPTKKKTKEQQTIKIKIKQWKKLGFFEGGGRKNSHIIFKKVC